MPESLKRYYGSGDLHYITCSCYQRKRWLGTDWQRDLFLRILEEVRKEHRFVLVTWDDWGGWYDHVLPWRCNNVGVCSGYPGSLDGGGSEYVYGFRVPLLVVSA